MTEKKQITIYDLLPLFKGGFVAMSKDNVWVWFRENPDIMGTWWTCAQHSVFCADLSRMFNIAPFAGDWKDSLMKCGEKK